MKSWKSIAAPHPDVLEGTFLQSEFAADISAVRDGKASREYQDATAFFERTYITEGMRVLLTQVAERLNGRGGEPVIQLQTAFGGGKTHTMLAVYHLATRTVPLKELPGVAQILDTTGLMEVPTARMAILDGTASSPGAPWKRGKETVRTLWGELAWQLGGAEGFALVKEADKAGTSPGKDTLRELLERYAPCVVLIDELVAYIRQFGDGQALSGGTYNSNLSFVQALTEAVKMVPSAMVLASLPESEVEVGDSRGVAALKALEKTFGRVQALWKPVATEEAFEIVRRRLFQRIVDEAGRDEVCRAFYEMYKAEGARMPSETQEARYLERLRVAYPIHPEVFDRLYEDWTTLDGFQRTRGVLKLMARVIYRLWKDQSGDPMIMPGSLPLYDAQARNELTYLLPAGWDAVIDKDIDGDKSEAHELEKKEARFGAVAAARRVARTVFLGSAPASAGLGKGTRGVDRGRVLLGCVEPGQASALYLDALGRLADRLHYLNASGERGDENTRYWFDVRANLRREMEDRKGRFDERSEVRGRIAELVQAMAKGGAGHFGAIHVFTPHADIPDDATLRLVVLGPGQAYGKEETRPAFDEVRELALKNGTKPRFRANRLVFVAADASGVKRLRDAVRTALAWRSIVDDIASGRLNIDRLQEAQAKKEATTSDAVAARAARDAYRWVLCPSMFAATDREMAFEAHPVNTGGSGSWLAEVEKVCEGNELVIPVWSAVHLKARLKELYWKGETAAVKAVAVWEDTLKYLYMPRLVSKAVFEKAVRQGAATRDYFATALGEGPRGYEGFRFGDGDVQLDDTLLLVEPGAAEAFEAAREAERREAAAKAAAERGAVASQAPVAAPGAGGAGSSAPAGGVAGAGGAGTGSAAAGATRAVRHFTGSVAVKAGTAKSRLMDIADEVIAVLAQDPGAEVRVTVEIQASFPTAAPDHVRRAVSENATTLGFEVKEWE